MAVEFLEILGKKTTSAWGGIGAVFGDWLRAFLAAGILEPGFDHKNRLMVSKFEIVGDLRHEVG